MHPTTRWLFLPILLAGCRTRPAREAIVVAPSLTQAAYRCDDSTQVAAVFHNDSTESVVLRFHDTTVTLRRQISADGGRYADSTIEFWDKGREAYFTRHDTRVTCRVLP